MKFPLYSFVYTLLAFGCAPAALFRGLLARKRLRALRERWLGPPAKLKKGPRAWVHSLSLGETLSALPLITALENRGFEVVLSGLTQSGQAALLKHRPDSFRFYPPYDFPGAVRRALRAVQPDLFVLVETDIWPNLLAALNDSATPLALVGARLSPRSFKGYRRLGRFWADTLNLFDLIAAQSEEDQELFLALGVKPDKLTLTGSLKFDLAGDRPPARETASTWLKALNWPEGPWIVAGSTHKGEEEALLESWARLRPNHPNLNLLLAPRDQSRFEEVRQMAASRGFPLVRRSGPGGGPLAGGGLFLLDSLGELNDFYSLARVAFVGKSLGEAHEGGGHNPLEPAAWGHPVVFGPRMHNFKALARDLVNEGGALMVQNQSQLTEVLGRLLRNPGEAQDRGQKGLNFIKSRQGAAARTMAALEPLLARAARSGP